MGGAGPQIGQTANAQGVRREQPVQRNAADLALWRVEAGSGGDVLLCPERGPGCGMERCPGHDCGGNTAGQGTKPDQGVDNLVAQGARDFYRPSCIWTADEVVAHDMRADQRNGRGFLIWPRGTVTGSFHHSTADRFSGCRGAARNGSRTVAAGAYRV